MSEHVNNATKKAREESRSVFPNAGSSDSSNHAIQQQSNLLPLPKEEKQNKVVVDPRFTFKF